MLVEVEPGVRLCVQDRGAGRPIVLIAGFGLSHPVWEEEVRELAGAGYRALCIDLRGTGGSDKPPGDHSIERHSLDVQTVLERLELRDAVLVGWSFGGQVCFHLAGTAAQRVARLVLVCSNGVRASRSEAFPFGPPGDKALAVMLAAEREDPVGSRRDAILSGFPDGREPAPGVVDRLLALHLQLPTPCAEAWYEAYLTTDLTHLVDRVTVPVLQIVGTADAVTTPAGAAWLRDRLADARIVELDGVGHYPMVEAGPRFREALLEFVREG